MTDPGIGGTAAAPVPGEPEVVPPELPSPALRSQRSIVGAACFPKTTAIDEPPGAEAEPAVIENVWIPTTPATSATTGTASTGAPSFERSTPLHFQPPLLHWKPPQRSKALVGTIGPSKSPHA